jgi:2-dehydro-3-deoxyphosphogluconate aldolase / (4S)-4-hydroxy-2-oxoglutarate aldolase
MTALTFDELFAGSRVLAILRGLSPPDTLRACATIWDAGLPLVEVTIQTPDAVPSLVAACSAAAERGLRVGAGTVTDVAQIAVVERAGAAYTVAPGLDAHVARASVAAGLPHLPGVATASEIQQARKLGLSWLKVFPAASLGSAWLAAQRAPFPWIRIVATGGIDIHNAQQFLQAGATVVGLGSSLLSDGALDRLKLLSEDMH